MSKLDEIIIKANDNKIMADDLEHWVGVKKQIKDLMLELKNSAKHKTDENGIEWINEESLRQKVEEL